MTSVPLPETVQNRRQFLLSTSALALWPFLDLRIAEAADRSLRMPDDPFRLGVASGDPAPDGFVIWTRLCPDPLHGGGMPPEDVRVEWQVAHDEGMQRVASKGVTTAAADWAHSVHVEVQGLQPDRVYFYQFKVGLQTSPVGRTRTAPAPDALLDSLKFAFVSCQRFEDGYYTAYEHLLRDDLRAVIHLGDYIYENSPKAGTPRHFVAPEIFTLEDYRARHALYRTDPHLQAAHAACPWIVTWDDHEVDNNYAGEIPDKPVSDPAEFLKRRANAYKAYYEHMPLRKSTVPRGPAMDLYRQISFGRLTQFSILDTRQYRTDQPCGDGYRPYCDGVSDPNATMLGQKQEAWLYDGLISSPARWNVLAQQVILAPVDFASNPLAGDGPTYSMDKWGGYEAARTRLIRFLSERQIPNPVVLTGDVHCNWVNDLKLDFQREGSLSVGTEFVGTSVTSTGDGSEKRENTDKVLSRNPFVKFFNSERGYVRCEVTPATWRSDYRTVPYVSRPGAACNTRASYLIENGRPDAVRVS